VDGDAVGKARRATSAASAHRIIADESPERRAREAVQTRLDCGEDAYRKAVGPLFGLSKAEDITGIGRGIAFQLVEALACSSARKSPPR